MSLSTFQTETGQKTAPKRPPNKISLFPKRANQSAPFNFPALSPPAFLLALPQVLAVPVPLHVHPDVADHVRRPADGQLSAHLRVVGEPRRPVAAAHLVLLDVAEALEVIDHFGAADVRREILDEDLLHAERFLLRVFLRVLGSVFLILFSSVFFLISLVFDA